MIDVLSARGLQLCLAHLIELGQAGAEEYKHQQRSAKSQQQDIHSGG